MIKDDEDKAFDTNIFMKFKRIKNLNPTYEQLLKALKEHEKDEDSNYKFINEFKIIKK